MTLPVFVARDLPHPAEGDTLTWTGPEAHHACHVQRLQPGHQIELVDGAGNRITATIASPATGKRDTTAVDITIDHINHEPAPTPQLVLVQALAKDKRDEQSIEMATELGVDTVIPWMAHRCVVRWDGPRLRKGVTKWTNVTTAAMKQSRRSYAVTVTDPLTTPDLATCIHQAVTNDEAVYLLYENATDRFAHHMRALSDADRPPTKIWLIVGPEGGIDPNEAAQLVDAGATAVKLGDTIMRVSSAAPAAMAVAIVASGRWD